MMGYGVIWGNVFPSGVGYEEEAPRKKFCWSIAHGNSAFCRIFRTNLGFHVDGYTLE